MLSEKIVNEYHRINRVSASHLSSYIAFEYWQKQYSKLDLYTLLRLPEEDLEIDYQHFRDLFVQHRDRLFELKEQKKVNIASHMKEGDIDEMIDHGFKNLGLFHVKRPLTRKGDKVITQDITTLYYYHNRTEGYDF